MQNKGAIRLFAILLILVCIFQISFTVVTKVVEKKAREFAYNDEARAEANKLANGEALLEHELFDSIAKAREKYYFDSIATKTVFNIGIRKYTYNECKEREINLGLDLKGGMNVTLEISVVEIIKAMSNYSNDPTFVEAIAKAHEMQKNSQEDYVTLFAKAFTEVDPDAKLAAIFSTVELKDRINFNSTNEEVLSVIRDESDQAIDRTFNILRTRIDKFGVAQPNIQQLSTRGRILVELPGVKDPKRVRKLLKSTAKLEFWETYEYADLYQPLADANTRLGEILSGSDTTKTEEKIDEKIADTTKSVENQPDLLAKMQADTVTKDTSTNALLNKLGTDTSTVAPNADEESYEEWAKKNPLFSLLRPALVQDEQGQYFPGRGPVVGYAAIKDTAKINHYLGMNQMKVMLPRSAKFAWTVKPYDKEQEYLQLIALKVTSRDGRAALEGDVVVNARQDFGQNGQNEVTMAMNGEGASKWKRITEENIGKSVAIVLDDYVYSFPTVNDVIPNGRSSISGQFTINEAKDLANVLKAGKLPAPANIVEEALVGPTMGREAITAGFMSFLVAFLLVLIYMAFYYSTAGVIADISLFANFFFIIGILASLGAVLTLPGIAGIVLTMGMAVDANVIIYERVREEIGQGKGLRLAVADGFKNSYSAIIDGNVTTLLTGIILYWFGTGPVKGFATTLVIGIFTTLFTAIFISRLNFERMLGKNKDVKFFNKLTEGAFKKIKIDWIGNRKKFYIISSLIITAGIISLFSQGLSLGVDFSGGRTYVVRFENPIVSTKLAESLTVPLESAPIVKTFGPSNQVKVTTKYLYDTEGATVDDQVEERLFAGLQSELPAGISFEKFKDQHLMSSQKVGPTIADDILKAAFWAILFSLVIIFIYIFIRFSRWQFAMGAIAALFHDALILLSLFSLLYPIMPFSLEIDQAFIAAILTVVGYSINDTVVIFDRIREYLGLYKKKELKEITNDALNSTLSRTINTTMTTFITLIIIFIFGGEVIRGFMFALMIGTVTGSYSSLCIATPLYYDTYRVFQKRQLEKSKLRR
ncbi:MAG: protein translocase subunit SecDF [Bacteroidetes bacterium]|nr:protein translocase subunit SecDF [Bacteroidota bacterium]MBU1720619.1 protein translocase subunit SecDF [Bacteroidota bacterium]